MYSDDGDPAAPGLAPETRHVTAASITLDVDGEVFTLTPDEYDGTTYTWVSGPNPGYGFGLSPTTGASLEQHRAHIRAFLAEIDPGTGHLGEE